MCPTGTFSQKRKRGFMEDGTYYKVLNEVKKHRTPLRFIRWGEPFMHPKLIDYIKDAKKEGLICHVNTNGSFLDENRIEELINIPLDSIKFSFQGIDKKTYHEMRNIDFFDKLLSRVKLLYQKRGEKEFPYIHISTSVTYETKEQIEKFKKGIKNFADKVSVGRTILEYMDPHKVNLGEKDKNTLRYLITQESLVKKIHPECSEVFDKFSINWDGTVSACCADYDNKMIIGDVKEDTLKKIWNSPPMNYYRKMLVDMRHDELEICKTCYDEQSLQTPGIQGT